MLPLRSLLAGHAQTATAVGVAASVFASPAAAQSKTPYATVVLFAPTSACSQARLDEQTVARGADGAFTFDSLVPGPRRLTCGRALNLYLTSDARLRVTIGDSGTPRFAGSGASANSFLHAPPTMGTNRFAALWTSSPNTFAREWNAAYAADRRALRAVNDADAYFVQRESLRLRFRYAWGRVTYPYFHWRETAAGEIVPDSSLRALLADLPLADQRWWSLPEHRLLIDSHVHERARALLGQDPALRTGDVRWLRAEFMAATSLLDDPALVRQVTTRLIETHVDESGSRGIDSVRGRWLRLGPDSAARHRVDSMVAEDRGKRDGHPIAIYQTIDGVDLELHVLHAERMDSSTLRPAMLWFHGGSGATGTWWHSPGVVSALRQNGVTVVAVEYRTGNRFDAGPLEQIADAATAYAWISRNTTSYLIDPQRIGVAGFSSGSTLALLLSTRGVEQPLSPPPAATERRYPAATIVTGACPNPGGPREDGYFRRMIARHGALANYSPLGLVAAGQPPMLLIHGTKDEYCSYHDARAFVERSVAEGNSVELITVEGAGHFFGFFYPPGRRQMRDAIAIALRRWGWSPP